MASPTSQFRRLTLTIAVMCVLAGGACGESPAQPSGPTVQPSPQTPAGALLALRIEGNHLVNAPGQTTNLTASASFSGGRTIDVTDEVTWTSNRPAVAEVGPRAWTPLTLATPFAVVTGKSIGTAEIRAVYANQTASLLVVVGVFTLQGSVRQVAPHETQLVSGAVVTLTSDVFGVLTAPADDDGFEFARVSGSPRLVVQAPGFETTQMELPLLKRDFHLSTLWMHPRLTPNQERFRSVEGSHSGRDEYWVTAAGSGELTIDVRGYTYDGVIAVELLRDGDSRIAFLRYTGKETPCRRPGSAQVCFAQMATPVDAGRRYKLIVTRSGLSYDITLTHPQ